MSYTCQIDNLKPLLDFIQIQMYKNSNFLLNDMHYYTIWGHDFITRVQQIIVQFDDSIVIVYNIITSFDLLL